MESLEPKQEVPENIVRGKEWDGKKMIICDAGGEWEGTVKAQ